MQKFYQFYFLCSLFLTSFFLASMEKEKPINFLPLIDSARKPLAAVPIDSEDSFLQQIAQQIAERKHQQEMNRLFPLGNQLVAQGAPLSLASLGSISDWLRDKELFGE